MNSEQNDGADDSVWRGDVDENVRLDASAAEAAELDEAIARLHGRLEQQAQDARMLDLAYTTVDSPVGSLLLVATETGLIRLAFDVEDHDGVLDMLARRVSARVLRAPRRLDRTAAELDEYFAGERRSFDVPLDLSLSSGFRQLVQRHLPSIAYGHTESYRQVAELVGNPKAVRAVGSACATNPLPIVVPCHRVLRADGTLGGYIGGLPAKSALLELEKAGARLSPADPRDASGARAGREPEEGPRGPRAR